MPEDTSQMPSVWPRCMMLGAETATILLEVTVGEAVPTPNFPADAPVNLPAGTVSSQPQLETLLHAQAQHPPGTKLRVPCHVVVSEERTFWVAEDGSEVPAPPQPTDTTSNSSA